MNRETLLKKYRIKKFVKNNGKTFYKVQLKFSWFWKTAQKYQGYYAGDGDYRDIKFHTMEIARNWIDDDIKIRIKNHGNKISTSFNLEPLEEENLFTELIEFIKQ